MSRCVYVLRDGQLVPKSEAGPLHGDGHSGPYVHSDTMDPIRSMADGKVYDSKSRYTAELHARGCRIVGNDRLDRTTTPLPSARAAVRRAYSEHS